MPPFLRIAMLASRFDPAVGGTERQALALAKALAAKGLDIEIITHRFRRDLPVMQERDGFRIVRVGLPIQGFWGSITFVAGGLRHLLRKRPDILHAHMIASGALLGLLVGAATRRKTVVKVACAGPYGDVGTSKRFLLGRLKLTAVLRRTDRLVCLTQAIEDEILAEGAPRSALVRIPNGVDTDLFRPATSDQEKLTLRRELHLAEGRWILFSGRLTAQKRPSVLLEAFMRLAHEMPDVRLVMLGDGPEKKTLMEQVEKEGLGGRVLLRENQPDMERYYRCADVFALPSAGEGLSNSLLEAMASGLPCVSTDHGGAEEMIQHGQSGLLCRVDDPDGLAQALRSSLSDPVQAKAFGLAARRIVLEKYRLQSVADQYISLYRELTHE